LRPPEPDEGAPNAEAIVVGVFDGKMRNDLIDMYEMASSLVATLEPHVDRILEAKRAYGLEAVLEVVITITLDETKSTPAIGFDSRVISFLHSVGASIDIDMYRGES